MAKADLKGKTQDQLKDMLLELKKEAFNLRFQKVTGELENTARIRRVRREIARVNTLLNASNDNKKVISKAAKAKGAAKTSKKPSTAKKETKKDIKESDNA